MMILTTMMTTLTSSLTRAYKHDRLMKAHDDDGQVELQAQTHQESLQQQPNKGDRTDQKFNSYTVVRPSVVCQAVLFEAACKREGGTRVDYQQHITSVAMWDGIKAH
jgi:hypothetical protein